MTEFLQLVGLNLASIPLADVGGLAAEAVDHATLTPTVESFFSVAGLFTLGMLVLLQIVLGFDNLLYISIESKRVEEKSQSKVRRLGIGLAIIFVLFFVVV